MTYFRFIKWLMFLNIYTMIIMFCVITVPYLALGPYNFNSSLTNANVSGYKEAIECTTDYEVYHKNLTDSETIGQQVLDLLQGTVSLKNTCMVVKATIIISLGLQIFSVKMSVIKITPNFRGTLKILSCLSHAGTFSH